MQTNVKHYDVCYQGGLSDFSSDDFDAIIANLVGRTRSELECLNVRNNKKKIVESALEVSNAMMKIGRIK